MTSYLGVPRTGTLLGSWFHNVRDSHARCAKRTGFLGCFAPENENEGVRVLSLAMRVSGEQVSGGRAPSKKLLITDPLDGSIVSGRVFLMGGPAPTYKTHTKHFCI